MDKRLKARRIFRILWKFLNAEFIRIVPGPDLEELLSALRNSRVSLDEKVRKAHEALQDTAQLVDELEGTLKQNMDKLSSLREQYRNYSQLAEIEQEKAKVILEQVSKTLKRGKSRDRLERLLISLISGFIIFVLGILLGPVIKAKLGVG